MLADASSSTSATAPNATAIERRRLSSTSPWVNGSMATRHCCFHAGWSGARLALTDSISACACSRVTPARSRPSAPSQW